MKKIFALLICTAAVALLLTACWRPSVAEVPITAPWDKMNLPLKENARVWASDDKMLKSFTKPEGVKSPTTISTRLKRTAGS